MIQADRNATIDPPGRVVQSCAAAILPGLLLLLLMPHAAYAHSLSLIHGSVAVHDDRVTIELQSRADDLLHSTALSPHADGCVRSADLPAAARQHALDLLERIIVRDAGGERLAGSLTSIAMDAIDSDLVDERLLRALTISSTLEYRLERFSRFISLQQDVERRMPGLPSRIVLTPHGSLGELVPSICLTSGGNVAVLRLTEESKQRSADKPDSTVTAVGDFLARAGRLSAVRAVVHVEVNAVTLDVQLPVPVLETWLPISRRQRDFIEIDEQRAARQAIESLISERISVRINKSQAEPHVHGVAFLEVEDDSATRSVAPRRVSAVTSRLWVSLRFDSPDPVADLTLDWDLFNSAILTASALLIDGGQVAEHDLSTYAPRLAWQRR